MQQSASEGPDTSKDEIDFINFFWAVRRYVFRSQQTFQKSTNSLKNKKYAFV